MQNLNEQNRNNTPGNFLKYLILSLIIAVPIYVSLHFYTQSVKFLLETIMRGNQVLVIIGLTIIFLWGVFSGRFASMMQVAKNRKISKGLIFALGVLVIASLMVLGFIARLSWRPNHVFFSFLVLAIAFLTLSFSLGMLVKLVKAFVGNQIDEAKMQAINSQNELKMLQSQLSPHFLFNTLNNLYGISITQHQKIPPLLLKLSDLLRYAVYDTKEVLVPLKDELAYINNYIDFEKLRIGSRLELVADIDEITGGNIKIAPMLLIVFIENAFKHAKNTVDDRIYISIFLKLGINTINFSVENSHSKPAENNSFANRHSGFGLDNVTKRLDLLYPGEYQLDVKSTEKSYLVMLKLMQK